MRIRVAREVNPIREGFNASGTTGESPQGGPVSCSDPVMTFSEFRDVVETEATTVWATGVEGTLISGSFDSSWEYENGDPVGTFFGQIGYQTTSSLPDQEFFVTGSGTDIVRVLEEPFTGTPVPGYDLSENVGERYVDDVWFEVVAPPLENRTCTGSGDDGTLAWERGASLAGTGLILTAQQAVANAMGRAFKRTVNGEEFWYRWQAITVSDSAPASFNLIAADIVDPTES